MTRPTLLPDHEMVSPPTLRPTNRKRKRLTLVELAPEARGAIFRAAVTVIGEHGYRDASIARITAVAGIAHGTFYLYFKSRQALFDELLPYVGHELVMFIRDRVTGAKDIFDVEERGFRAIFEYMGDNPGFFRVINEAELEAPTAFKKHFELLIQHYIESLERGVIDGQIKMFDRSELEAVAYVFMSARNYLYLRYAKNSNGSKALPEDVVQTYLKLVRHGLR